MLGITSDNYIDTYTIAIDSTRCKLIQCRALGHELAHVFLDHFGSSEPVSKLEHDANEAAWSFYRAYKSGSLESI